jgi:RNA polymerase sigma factor (sigma-70 family)
MAEYSQSVTSPSLLVRLRDTDDQNAWREFVDKYGNRIYHWCRVQGLNGADCEDATQQVFIRLVHAMKTFRYDPAKGTFRAWLKTTTRYAVADVRRAVGHRISATGDSNVQEQIANVPDDGDFVELLTDAMLLEEVESRVHAKVREPHWQAYLMSKQGRPRLEVAQILNISPGAVSTAVYRIVGQLRLVFQELGAD